MPTFARRSAVVERLRRLLFTPSKLLAVGALALTFATADDASAQTYTMPNVDVGVADYGGLLYLADFYAYNDPSQVYDSTISLDGGTLALSTNMTAPIYDAETQTLHMWGLLNPEYFSGNVGQEEDCAEYMVEMYKGLGVDLEAIYGGPISKVVEHNGHFLDMSDGGVVYLFNSQQSADDKLGQFADMCGMLVSPQEINGDFTLAGNGTLLFNASESTFHREGDRLTAETIYYGKTTFNGSMNVLGGMAYISGDSEFNGPVTVYGYMADAQLDVNGGNHVFHDDVVAAAGALNFRGEDGGKVVLEKDVIVEGGRLYSIGAVEYQGNVIVSAYNDAPSFAMFTRTIMDDVSDGTATFGENSVVNLIGTAIYQDEQVVGYTLNTFANVDCLKTDVSVFGAALNYCNADQQTQDYGLANKFYVTYNENQTPTFLEWEAGRSNLENAIANGNVIDRDINGYEGHVAFTTVGAQYVAPGETANGYSVVIDAKNQDDYAYQMFGYTGDTFVERAFTVIQGDTNFGANGGDNKFSVWGESYFQLSDDGAAGSLWSVESCGMLGFTRGDETDPTKAPSVTAASVQFNNGSDYEYQVGDAYDGRVIEQIVTGGARLWIDTTYRDANGNAAQVDRKLGAIHADSILFGEQTKIWYDAISSVDSDVALTFELDAKTIKIDRSKYAPGQATADTTFDIVDATPEDVEKLFGAAQLVDATFTQTSANSAAGVVTVRAKDVAEYAAEQNMSEREQELAAKLDGARLDGGRALGFYDALYNEADQSKVRQTIHNLSLLGYNMLNAQGHFGNPTSSFFGGSSVSGEAKRGQSAEPDWPEPQPTPSAIAQTTYEPKRSIWAAYTHTAVDGDDYDCGGVTTNGYELRRSGIIGGIKRQIDATTSAGLFFGLSTPEVQSANALEGGYGTVGSNMEMTDFQFAGHFEKVFADVWELAAYVGGGTQTMEWERFANFGPDAGGFYQYQADGTGNTLTGTLYLSYRANLNDRWVLRPTIGVDSEHSWLYGFSENATVAGAGSESVLLNPYMDMFAQNYRYAKTYYNRNTARVGLSLAGDHPTGLAGLNGRVFYGVKLGGDDAPELTYYSDAYRWEDMASHEMGDSSLNVGGGGFMHLNRQKTLTATGDVNAIWYKNAQTFNVTGGVTYRF